jgi:hypothetical protein
MIMPACINRLGPIQYTYMQNSPLLDSACCAKVHVSLYMYWIYPAMKYPPPPSPTCALPSAYYAFLFSILNLLHTLLFSVHIRL